MFKSATLFLAVLVFTLIGLTFGWVSAASAAELTNCVNRPLEQGKAGEMVRVCEVKRAVSKPSVRVGQTVIIARLGTR